MLGRASPPLLRCLTPRALAELALERGALPLHGCRISEHPLTRYQFLARVNQVFPSAKQNAPASRTGTRFPPDGEVVPFCRGDPFSYVTAITGGGMDVRVLRQHALHRC
jgi:hypothetical protein